jgi:Na+/melibiose symporter-like transporter
MSKILPFIKLLISFLSRLISLLLVKIYRSFLVRKKMAFISCKLAAVICVILLCMSSRWLFDAFLLVFVLACLGFSQEARRSAPVALAARLASFRAKNADLP